LKEFLEALGTRVRSPLFGYALLAFIAFNWAELLTLFMSEETIEDRIIIFNTLTDYKTLMLFPLFIAAGGAIIYPWINLAFLYICSVPTNLKNSLQAQSEHHLLVKKQELEKIRSELLAHQEEVLIDRAKRDVELENINNEEVRERTESEIRKLREEKDLSSANNTDKHTKNSAAEDLIARYEQLASESNTTSKRSKYLDKALDLREKLAFEKT